MYFGDSMVPVKPHCQGPNTRPGQTLSSMGWACGGASVQSAPEDSAGGGQEAGREARAGQHLKAPSRHPPGFDCFQNVNSILENEDLLSVRTEENVTEASKYAT